MSEKEINKMFAQFLGWLVMECYVTPTDKDIKCLNLDTEFKEILPYTMKFKTNWNWLMLVVDKIENLVLETLILKYGSHEDEFTNATFAIFISSIETKIDIFGDMKREKDFIVVDDCNDRLRNTYEACVEFIKWYNQQSK